MHVERAQEILHSDAKIDVFYQENPVWIDKVVMDESHADITMLDTKEKLYVPVAELHEPH